jgi:hypothetical protein
MARALRREIRADPFSSNSYRLNVLRYEVRIERTPKPRVARAVANPQEIRFTDRHHLILDRRSFS